MTRVTLFLALLLPGFYHASSQTYTGTMVLKFGGSYTGTISKLDLAGENKGLIYIETSSSSQTKSKGNKTSSTLTEKNGYNPAIIKYLLIGDKTYYFKDLRLGYEDKDILSNCAVQLYFGKDSLAIYQWEGPDQKTGYYVCTPRFTDYAEDISHPKFDDDGFKHFSVIRFSRCEPLSRKIYSMEEGYFYTNDGGTPLEQKLAVWKRIMLEYMQCF